METTNIIHIPFTQVYVIETPTTYQGKTYMPNKRQSYNNIEELAQQIVENEGIRKPCLAFEMNGKYYLTDGHRRRMACELIYDQSDGQTLINMPLIIDTDVTEQKRVIDMVICNDGEPLNPIEQAAAIQSLLDGGMDDDEITAKTGLSNVYICNLCMLHKSPQRVKDLIITDVITATQAMAIMRSQKNWPQALQAIEKTIAFKQQQQGAENVRITEKDFKQASGKVNSVAAVKRAYNQFEKKGRAIRNDKLDIFVFIQRLVQNDIDYDELMASLYEPEIEEPKEKTVYQLALEENDRLNSKKL